MEGVSASLTAGFANPAGFSCFFLLQIGCFTQKNFWMPHTNLISKHYDLFFCNDVSVGLSSIQAAKCIMSATLSPVLDDRLICEVMGQRYALNVDSVVELVSLQGITVTSIPNTPQHVHGIANLPRGPLPVLDIRAMLGLTSLRDETQEVLQMLHDREHEHVLWLEELYASVRESRDFTLTTNPHLCKFGKWYDALRADNVALSRFTNDRLSLLEVVARFDKPHQRIHGIAEQVMALEKAGSVEEAKALIETVRETDLASMLELFATARRLLGELRQGIVVVIENNSRRLGLLFDNASDVKQYTDEDHHPLDMADSKCGLIHDVIRDDGAGDMIQAIDLKALLKQCSADLENV